MERVIAEARRNNQPAYILVPSDYALAPVVPVDVRPLTLKSNAAALKKAIAAVSERLKGAKSVIALPAFTIARLGLQKELREAIEALGCPFATMVMEKCLIDEGHPQFAGLYAGAMSAQSAREIVEGADVVLDLGGVNLNDITTAAYSAKLDPARFVTIGLNDVRIGEKVITGVRLRDMLVELTKLKSPARKFRRTAEGAPPPIAGKPSDRITMDALYPRYAGFIRKGDTVVLETGSSSLGLMPVPLADGVRVEAQVLWGSIGWATPAAFGVALADPGRRTILITGEGSHQLDGERDRQHGAVRRQCHRLCSQQRGLSDRAGAGGKSGLVLQRPRAVGDMQNCRARSDAPIGSLRGSRRSANSTRR